MNGLDAAALIVLSLAAIVVRHHLYRPRPADDDEQYVERDWQWP